MVGRRLSGISAGCAKLLYKFGVVLQNGHVVVVVFCAGHVGGDRFLHASNADHFQLAAVAVIIAIRAHFHLERDCPGHGANRGRHRVGDGRCGTDVDHSGAADGGSSGAGSGSSGTGSWSSGTGGGNSGSTGSDGSSTDGASVDGCGARGKQVWQIAFHDREVGTVVAVGAFFLDLLGVVVVIRRQRWLAYCENVLKKKKKIRKATISVYNFTNMFYEKKKCNYRLFLKRRKPPAKEKKKNRRFLSKILYIYLE